jgi:Fic family protein
MSHSFDLGFLQRLAFTTGQLSSMGAIREHRGRQELFRRQSPQTINHLRLHSMIESAESSNRLEGITAQPKRIESLILQQTTPRNRSEQEIAGYRDALQTIHETALTLPVACKTILNLHEMLCRYSPMPGGVWKDRDNQIVERNPDGTISRVRFTPVPAAETPEQMERFVQRLNNALGPWKQEPLVIIPLAVLDFLCIHPFLDGNGRMARLLTLHLLYRSGYDVGRYLSLERIIEESKESYYDTLEFSSRGWHDGDHDVRPWLDYFWGVLLRTYKDFEDRVGTLAAGRGSKTAQIRRAVDRRTAPFSISAIEDDCPGVGRDLIRLILRELRDENVLRSTGLGRGAKWIKT